MPAFVAQGPRSGGSAEPVGLSIVIFTRNDVSHLRACLHALATSPPARPCEILVFDNASEDDTASFLATAPVAVSVLGTPKETSFSAGNNQGLAAASHPLVLFLNPDTEPSGPLLDDACESLLAAPEAALLGPRLRYPDGSAQSNGWALPTPGTLVAERLGRPRELPQGPGPLTDVGWLMGCFLLGRREELLASGGFDERFWFHGTDLEICARARARGRRVVRLERQTLLHVGHPDWDPARRARSREATALWLDRDVGRWAGRLVRWAARLRA